MPRRGENIRKRTDGRWEGRYIESYKANGKACYRSVYGTTYAETKEKLKQHKKLSDKGIVSKINMTDLCREWLSVKRNTIKESTYVRYHNFIENHMVPNFRGIRAAFVTSNLVCDFIAECESLSEKTVRDMLSVLMQIIKYGQSKNYIGYFDFDGVLYPKAVKKELPVLKSTELIRLVNHVQMNFEIQKIGVLLSLFMGIRLGEICALQWKDVNFSEETIHIYKTMQRLKNIDSKSERKTKIVIDVPKSQKSVREIPVPSFLMELFREYRSGDEAYILTGTADYIEPRTYQRMFSRYLKDSGVANINFHALRHTFATRAVEQEFDIKSLSEILGHSSVKFTLERYVHPSDEYKKKNLEKLSVFY